MIRLAYTPIHRASLVALILALGPACSKSEDDGDGDADGSDGQASDGHASDGHGSDSHGSDGGSDGSGGSDVTGGSDGSGDSDSTGGSDSSGGSDTGGGANCPTSDVFTCTFPIDCKAYDCGDPWSWFDEMGCMRQPCQPDGDACPEGEYCYVPATDGGCVSSGLGCSDGDATCECGGTDDCGGSFCLPMGLPARCGGFVGGECPMGTTCEDIPDDDCEPGSGGADCPGICR